MHAYKRFGGIFELNAKEARLAEINQNLEKPEVWQNSELSQQLGKERVKLQALVERFKQLDQSMSEQMDWLDILLVESDQAQFNEVQNTIENLTKLIEQLEFERMFSGKFDANNAYLEIQSGSGGTEAQDWAEMLLRMYLRFCAEHNFKTEISYIMPGEVAGIKNATVYVEGAYAYGWLRTETGVHRLVRKSPFDSGNRRHTSFAAVFVTPEIDDDIEIEINPADLRIDTYRSSGAGGQHVNTTESAIRITHVPTNVVVQCQSERSQHQNRAKAMQQLKAKLYELELKKKNAEKENLEASKSDITWGSQIRSYVLDDSRVKDLRTGVETSNTQAVLDGALDKFIEACLKEGK